MPLVIEMGWTEAMLYENSEVFLEELAKALKRKYDIQRRTQNRNHGG